MVAGTAGRGKLKEKLSKPVSVLRSPQRRPRNNPFGCPSWFFMTLPAIATTRHRVVTGQNVNRSKQAWLVAESGPSVLLLSESDTPAIVGSDHQLLCKNYNVCFSLVFSIGDPYVTYIRKLKTHQTQCV